MKNKSFTLVEIIMVVVVIGILATVALPAYKSTVEDAKAKVCKANEKAIAAGYNICVMEKGVVPACLSEIPQEYIKEAYGRILKQKDAWKIKLAYFIVGWEKRGLAYAAPFLNTIAKGDINLITCPSDTTPPATGGVSYGINSSIASVDVGGNVSIDTANYDTLAAFGALVGDCDSDTCDEAAFVKRHKKIKFLAPAEDYTIVADKDGDVNKEGLSVAPVQQSCKRTAKEEFQTCKSACPATPEATRKLCLKGCHNAKETAKKQCEADNPKED